MGSLLHTIFLLVLVAVHQTFSDLTPKSTHPETHTYVHTYTRMRTHLRAHSLTHTHVQCWQGCC